MPFQSVYSWRQRHGEQLALIKARKHAGCTKHNNKHKISMTQINLVRAKSDGAVPQWPPEKKDDRFGPGV